MECLYTVQRYHLYMSNASSRLKGWRIHGLGKHPEIASAVREKLRSLGFQAINFVLTNNTVSPDHASNHLLILPAVVGWVAGSQSDFPYQLDGVRLPRIPRDRK